MTTAMTTATTTATTCGCPEFGSSLRSTRRGFLKGAAATAGAGVLASTVGDAFTQVSFGAPGDTNVLVVLSMRGGADGLSLVVPHSDRGYAAARPKIAVPTSTLLAKDSTFGLHPSLAPLLPMWNAGTFGAVHAVGLPQPNRSHFTAMEVVEDADPGSPERRGWINRMIGQIGTAAPQDAVQLGSGIVPTSLYGPSPVLGLRQLRNLDLPGPDDPESRRLRRVAYDLVWGGAKGALGRGAQAALTTTDRIGFLGTLDPIPQHGAQYPTGDLGHTLSETAALIRAKVGARVIAVDYGDWDMHTQLGTVDWGAMQSNARELAQALNAFFTDLGGLASSVTVVTISEFGRRLQENGSAGLDHGYGSCMFVLGAGVRGGKVHGRWPGLAGSALVEGDLAVLQDYRSVLTEVVRSRFPDVNSSQVFPNFIPEPLGVMTA